MVLDLFMYICDLQFTLKQSMPDSSATSSKQHEVGLHTLLVD